MNRRTHRSSLAILALSLAMTLPVVGCADGQDGSAEETGEKIDDTAGELRDSATRGINAAREAVEKTGEAVDERARQAQESISE